MGGLSKQLEQQRYIYKIHSSRLRYAKWNLTLPLEEARKNDEIISLASSQLLRWIDNLNGIVDADGRAKSVRDKIRKIKTEPVSVHNKREIKKLYKELDLIQYKPDYLCLIIDRVKDYHRACKGFSINNVSYKRLLGTNGGIKNSTIVFVSERLHGELYRRIENGRNADKPIVTAKLEAYKSLTCSASTPVSFPNGVAVVDECETTFLSDIISLTDENDGEPIMETLYDQEVKLDATDGFGLMSPALAERWSNELGLDYTVSGCNTRMSFEKGMVFTFDYVDFADKVAGGNYIVKDAWGDEFDVRDVELILTTSMVKLWESYSSCEEYISVSKSNGYTFGVTKTCPKHIENERSLNYQFIQSFDLDDSDIDDLISPTVNEIRDVLGGDWRKTVLFLQGSGLNEKNIYRLENGIAKAIMVEPRMINDPYIQGIIYKTIRNRINEAKIGVLKVHGNYSIASGDPYALCQNMFGLEVTGILKSGEIYNKYWCDSDAEDLLCFRAPMTGHNNIRRMSVNRSEEASYWYKYMNTCTIFNSWDTSMSALNGMDFDGDLVMLTDNPVLLRRHKKIPALMCAQRRAEKKIPTEEDFIKSNIDSFGNDIGKTTNWITSMFEVQSHFEKDSREYNELDYRIKCGQLYQQNAIDKAKGIICKPMPKTWYDRHAVNKIEGEDNSFYRNIVADKKPYFMRYIYPELMRKYNTYIKNTEKNSLREFKMSVSELASMNKSELSQEHKSFLKNYDKYMPVGIGDCVMNKICRRFESEFDGYISKHSDDIEFDYSIMKSGVEYSPAVYKEISILYDEYNKRVQNYISFADINRIDSADAAIKIKLISDEFRKNCLAVCPNGMTLCDIVLDMCYQKQSTKSFAWSMCGDDIIRNLLRKNGCKVNIPMMDSSGDIYFAGNKFMVKTIGVENEYCFERK